MRLGPDHPSTLTTLSQLGISLDDVEFQAMPPLPVREIRQLETHSGAAGSNLTIAEAKKVLAATFGVKPEAVEITIRG